MRRMSGPAGPRRTTVSIDCTMTDLRSLGSVADLPGGPLSVSTVAMAVADLQASMALYHETLGWGPWSVYRQEPPGLTDMRYRGSPAEFSFLVAGTSIPGMPNFWLCQPLKGPSLYRDLVEEGIPGAAFHDRSGASRRPRAPR